VQRDFANFPDDDNGDVLWRMHQHGDDLSKPREVDFSVIFPTSQAALDFALHLLKNGQKVSFGPYEGNADLPWQVEAHPVLLPNHSSITEYENRLARDAKLHGGRNDGWGSMQQD